MSGNPREFLFVLLTAGDFGVRVLFQVSVEDRVGDLIAHFVWKRREGGKG
jgi:hypothetical protein